MALVMVERAFDSPQDYAQLQAKLRAAAFCYSTYRVRWLKTFFALDGLHMVCLYDAPDAESVRATQRTAGVPVEHAWPVTTLLDEPLPRPPGYSLVVVQRAVPAGATEDQVRYVLSDPNGCGKRLRLVQPHSFLSPDCRRVCCVYYSPDLESIRVANREMGAPIERLWAASLTEAPA